MYKISDLLGKPLLSLCEAKFLGTIANIYFDAKTLKGTFIKLYSEDDDAAFLPLSKLCNINNDAAVVKTTDGIVDCVEGLENPINSPAFNQDGKSLGIISDVIVDGGKIISFVIGDGEIGANTLVSAGKVLIFNDTGKPIKLRPPVKRDTVQKKEVEFPTKSAYAPSYDFLLGKKLQRTIVAMDGKVIAREGENVTGDIIRDAKKEGKLVILALNSL